MKRIAFIFFLMLMSLSWRTAYAQDSTGAACNSSAIYDASTNGATKIISGVAADRVFICGFDLFAAGTVNVKLVSGTGTNCASSTANITPAFEFTAQTGLVDPAAYWRGLTPAPLGNDVCISTSAGVPVQAIVYYLLSP